MDERSIDELVKTLDEFMQNGGGHMNVTSDGQIHETEKPEVVVFPSNDCGTNMACQVPTLHKGIDDEETK